MKIADQAGARLALVGDRHQLPAVGRGGVLDLTTDAAHDTACLRLETVHRFADPDYADLSLAMRAGQNPAEAFDALLARVDIQIHPSDTERVQALTTLSDVTDANDDVAQRPRTLMVADTREQVAALNAAIRDHRQTDQKHDEAQAFTTAAGERIGVGDTITTRRNDRTLGVANRQTWTVTGIEAGGGSLGAQATATPRDRAKVQVSRGERTLPAAYALRHVELAYARTVYGAQGGAVDRTHFVLGEQTGAASAYVAMTRDREANTAHLVAENVDEAREQWVGVFSRDRADLGPARAATKAAEDLDRYGSLDWETAEAIQVTEAAAATHQRRPDADSPAKRRSEPARPALPR